MPDFTFNTSVTDAEAHIHIQAKARNKVTFTDTQAKPNVKQGADVYDTTTILF